jgi:hypothetical protein
MGLLRAHMPHAAARRAGDRLVRYGAEQSSPIASVTAAAVTTAAQHTPGPIVRAALGQRNDVIRCQICRSATDGAMPPTPACADTDRCCGDYGSSDLDVSVPDLLFRRCTWRTSTSEAERTAVEAPTPRHEQLHRYYAFAGQLPCQSNGLGTAFSASCNPARVSNAVQVRN